MKFSGSRLRPVQCFRLRARICEWATAKAVRHKASGFGGGGYEKTPTGKAIRACILYIAEYLECSMVKGKDHKCMEKWDEMDEKRKEKTKGSIDMDD